MASSLNTTTINSEFHQTVGQQEAERLDRMTNEHYRRGNAKLVSEMLKSYSFPSTKCSLGGSKLHIQYITEQQRKLLLEDTEQLRKSKALAMEIAALVKKGGYLTLSPYYLGLKRQSKHLEETERARRIKNVDECRARKSNALKVSDAIRVDAAVIRARFMPRGPLKTLKKNVVHATDKVHVPTGVKQAFSSFLQKANSLKDNLVHSVQNVIKGETVSLQAIRALEEAERLRRVAEDKTGFAVGNAKKISQLLHLAKFPALSHHNKGFYLYTSGIEERERTRRLANKFECESNKILAGQIANLISQLGWPLISSAKNLKFVSPLASLEEEERTRKLSDKKELVVAQMQAKKIAKLVGAALLPRNKEFALSHTRLLEEKERKYRQNNLLFAVHNAHREAELISDIGGIFYEPSFLKKTGQSKKVDVLKMKGGMEEGGKKGGREEALGELSQGQLEAQKKARKVAKLIQDNQFNKGWNSKQAKIAEEQGLAFNLSFDTKTLEENERKFRMDNKEISHQALVNANNVSRLIKQQNPYTPKKDAKQQKLKKSSSFSFKKPDFSLWAKKLDLPQPKAASASLIATVQKLYDLEVKLAEREEKQATSVTKGQFGAFSSNSHAAGAAKHQANAKRHLQWLQEAKNNTSNTSNKAPLSSPAKGSEIVQSPSIQRAALASH